MSKRRHSGRGAVVRPVQSREFSLSHSISQLQRGRRPLSAAIAVANVTLLVLASGGPDSGDLTGHCSAEQVVAR